MGYEVKLKGRRQMSMTGREHMNHSTLGFGVYSNDANRIQLSPDRMKNNSIAQVY